MGDADQPPKGPGGADRREHPRFGVKWRTRLKCPNWRSVSRLSVLNASEGGFFIATSKPPEPGMRVELTLQLPNGNSVFLQGVVRDVVTPDRALAQHLSPGAGVQIDAQYADAMRELAKLAAEANEPPSISSPQRAAVTQPAAVAAVAPAPSGFKLPAGKVAGAVGIDFGTSYSSVSVAIGDRVYILPDDEGRRLQPSVVAYPEKAPPIVGWRARQMLAEDPRRVVASIKRLLGRSIKDPNLGGFVQSLPYKTVEGPNDSLLIDMDGELFAVPQICSAIIGHMRDIAAKRLGAPVTQAVFSCPASYGKKEKAALTRAAEMARLKVLAIIEEPVAGSLAYGGMQGKNEMVAVYDFGGGTFDFSVLDYSADLYHIVTTAGDAWLGGDDFDSALAGEAADRFWRATEVELRQRVVEWQMLLLACEKAKRELTERDSAEVSLAKIVETPKPIDLRETFKRTDFEVLCHGLLTRSLGVCQEALDSVGLDASNMTEVVVMGGVSRIPFIREAVGKFFGREIKRVVNPEEAVCLGAGLHAAQLLLHEVTGVVSAG